MRRSLLIGIYFLIVTQPAFAQTSKNATKEFTAPNGTKYSVVKENINADDVFTGKDRASAKTSIPDAKTEKTISLETFISSLTAKYPDSYMLAKNISKDASSDRVYEEKRIVTVDAYIFASKKEADNDFHVILSTDPSKEPIQYFTAEVSGIPRHSEYADDLVVPRDQFKQFFKDNIPGSAYEQFSPPIPVRVTGALFFDVDHKAGVVGPKGHRPATAWEIHPVTNIVFK